MNTENINNNEDDLKREAPHLFGFKKEEPYTAPDGYFEKFQSELQNKIHSKKISPWNWILKPVVWAPTMIVLIIAGIFVFKNDPTNENTETARTELKFDLNEISYDALDIYVNENLLADANTDDLVEMVGAENIPSLGIKTTSDNENKELTPTMEHVEESEMEEYILENLDEMEVY